MRWHFVFVASLAATCCLAMAQQDPELLRNALGMIYRRQNDVELDAPMAYRPRMYQGYRPYDGELSNDVDYLHTIEADQELTLPYEILNNHRGMHHRGPDKARQVGNYPDEEIPIDFDPSNDKPVASKRIPSVFRERIDHQQSRPPNKQMVELFLNKLGDSYNENEMDNDFQNELEYERMLQDYWEKYRTEKEWAQRYGENTEPNTTADKRAGKHLSHRPHTDMITVQFTPSDNVVIRKRFPVAKRSSSWGNSYLQSGKNHKKFVKSEPSQHPEHAATGTDPKVARDLSHIFGSEQKGVKDSKSKVPKKVSNGKKTMHAKFNSKKVASKLGKETVPVDHANDKFVEVKKKSVDWSRYFGIDRRRKKSTIVESIPESVDESWMEEQYKNALKKFELSTNEEMGSKRQDESNLDTIKSKLKNIEDMIIDEALKYTGAHEGETDSKEIQEVKDKIMSRLAAAYSLEKMRRALGEFKKSVAEQREKLDKQYNSDFDLLEPDESPDSHSPENQEPNGVLEKKRDCEGDAENKSDNNISQRLLEEGDCNVLDLFEHQCANLAAQFNTEVVQPLCVLHQICSICGVDANGAKEQNLVDNNPELGCFYMYVGESERVCAGDSQCRRNAHYALNTLRDPRAPPLSADLCPQSSACVASALESTRHHIQAFNMRHSI